MMGLAEPVAIVAHDAGAANIIFAWLAAEGPSKDRVAVAGPAAALWAERFGKAAGARTIEQVLDGAATLLSGTGWASDLEHEARRLARARGIRSIAVIDHWVNYRERFRRQDEEILPDALWVTDRYAVAEARLAVPECPVEERPNLYLAEQVGAAGPPPEAGDVLFVAEPARSNWGGDCPGEFQALDYFMLNRSGIGIPPVTPVRLRPHPSDPVGKYDEWLASNPGTALDRSGDMAAAVRPASWVIGLQSFALVIGLAAGRRAISALPPWAPACKLPHAEIVHMRSLIETGSVRDDDIRNSG
jgi:hypothetical protein